MTDLSQVGFVRHSLHDVQAGAAAMLGGLRGQLDPGHIEMARRLHEEKAIGAAQFQQLSAAAIAADEIDAARELAAQHRLGAEIIRIAVGVPAGKIILGVVGGGIKSGRFGAAEAATLALQDVASVGPEAQGVVSRAAAGRARARGGSAAPLPLAIAISGDGVCKELAFISNTRCAVACFRVCVQPGSSPPRGRPRCRGADVCDMNRSCAVTRSSRRRAR